MRETGAGVDSEVLVALRTHLHVFFEIFLPDDLAALFTLHPQSFGANFLFARGVQLRRFALKPSHRGCSNWVIESLRDLKTISNHSIAQWPNHLISIRFLSAPSHPF